MEFFIFVLIVMAAVVISAMQRANKPQATVAEMVHPEGFTATQQVMGIDKMTGIAIDESHEKLCLIRARPSGAWAVGRDGSYGPVQDPASSTVVGYGDILSAEVIEDIAPGQGFLGNKILRVELHVIVRSTATPVHTLVFLDSSTGSNSAAHSAAMEQARHWHGLLRAARERATPPMAPATATSVADELRKLAQLRDEGVLTEPEFQQQKARLLA